MADKEAGTIWTDANGFTRLTTIKTLTGVGPILTAIRPLSNGDWVTCWESPINTQVPLVTSGAYQSVLDMALLSFDTASGGIVTLPLLAPKVTDFAADRQTVDPVAIAPLIAACIGNLSNGAGSAAISYLGGFYQRRGSIQRGG